LAHPKRERARGRAYGPAVAHERGETARVREDDSVAAGPLVSESGGGKTALRLDDVGEPAERGRKAGRRWARWRFATGGLVLGPREGGLAWFSVQGRLAILRVGSIRPEGVGRVLSTGRWRSSAAGIAAGGLWVRDWAGKWCFGFVAS
jgi:hypothetical protein